MEIKNMKSKFSNKIFIIPFFFLNFVFFANSVDAACCTTPSGGTCCSGGFIDCSCSADDASCFLPGTKITMGDGRQKNIEDVVVGEEVLSFDSSFDLKPYKVLQIQSPIREGYYETVLEDGTILKHTNDHPFYAQNVDGKDQWVAMDPKFTFIHHDGLIVAQMKVGQEILKQDKSWKKIVSIDYYPGEVKTYNLESIEDAHTYFANETWTHNRKGPGSAKAFVFCQDDGGPVYPMSGVTVRLEYRDGYSFANVEVLTDATGWTPEIPFERKDGVGYFTTANWYRGLPAGGSLSNGTPYSQLVRDQRWSTSCGPQIPETGSCDDYPNGDTGCANFVPWESAWAHMCNESGRPGIRYTNCENPVADLSFVVKKVENSGFDCNDLALADSVLGLGLTVDVTGPANSGSYTPDTTIADTDFGDYTVDITSGAGSIYYDDAYLFCDDGVKTLGTGTSVSLTSTDKTIYIGAIEKSVVSGRLFDASDVDSCALFDLLPAALGSVFADGSTTDYTINTGADGYYSQEVASPDTYLLTPSVGSGFVDLKFPCQGSAANFTPSLGGGEQIFNFGFWRQYGGWWKAIGGDVYGQGGVSSVIPASLAVEQSLLGADANGQDGLVWYGLGNDIYLGSNPNAFLSNSSFSAESGRRESLYDYEFFLSKMSTLPKTAWDGYGKPVFTPDGVDYQIYTHTGDIDFDFDVSSSEKMVFLVDGNVNVTGDVMTAVGGTLTIISSGTITFQPSVTDAQGQFLADQIVVAGSGADSSDPQFRGEGTFSGWYSISLERDRGDLNNTEPSEQFTFRPDFIVNAPAALKRSIYSWKEVAP
jgi:hypothetical protein